MSAAVHRRGAKTLGSEAENIHMKTTNLLLHCGAAKVERDWLALMSAPRSTDTWFPIPHERLIREVETALHRMGMRVVNQAHGLSPDACRYFGLLQVAPAELGWTSPQPPTQDYSYVLGLRNSHDKRFPAAMVLGSQVFVCDNLAFSGEIKIARKHTRFIERDLPALIAQGTGQLAERWHQQDARFAAYKQTELGSHEAHDLIIRALDRGAFTPQQLPAVLTQWRTPNHPEFAESRTVWRLFNAVTESIKGSLWALPLRTQALHGLLDDHVCFVGRN